MQLSWIRWPIIVLWQLIFFFYMESMVVSGWNSSEKYVNSQLKINEIGITKFQPRNDVSWLHFGGHWIETRGYIYRVWSWLKILLIQVEIRLNFSRFWGCICCMLVLIDSPFSSAWLGTSGTHHCSDCRFHMHVEYQLGLYESSHPCSLGGIDWSLTYVL